MTTSEIRLRTEDSLHVSVSPWSPSHHGGRKRMREWRRGLDLDHIEETNRWEILVVERRTGPYT